MQSIHILYPFEQMLHRAERYEQAFAENEAVTVIDWGCSYKQEQGYIVLEWDNNVDPAFLHQLDADADVLDYCVYTVPAEQAYSMTLVPLDQAKAHIA